jgi:hypothetical protein
MKVRSEAEHPSKTGWGISGSAQAFAAKKRRVFFIHYENMIAEPVLEKIHHFNGNGKLAFLVAGLQILRFLREVIVLFLVAEILGIGVLLKIRFFRREMERSVIQQIRQNRPYDGIALAGFHGIVKLIDQLDQAFMLIVDFIDIDRERITPRNKRHCRLLCLSLNISDRKG